MNPVDRLTPEQKTRAAQLLEVIVRPGEHLFYEEIHEAQELFGYAQIVMKWPAKRGRPCKRKP
jgi:hypothetical protein